MDILIAVTILGFAAVVYSLWDVFSAIQKVGETLHQDQRDLIEELRRAQRA